MVTWTIENMDRLATTGMVVRVGWRVTETDGDVTAFTCENTIFDTPGDPFVDYQDLTQDQVLAWVQATDHAQAVAADVHARVQAVLNPTILSGTPW
jgi:hypothetical protein